MYPGWYSNRDHMIREIPDDYLTGAHNCVRADADALEYNRPEPQMRRIPQARCSAHCSIRSDMSVITDLHIVFDNGAGIYDDARPDVRLWINDRAGHDHGPGTKPSAPGHGRSRMASSMVFTPRTIS